MNGLELGDARRTKEERAKRKRLLQDELRVVQEQKAALEKQLASLRAGGGLDGPRGGVNGSVGAAAASGRGAATPSLSRGLKRPAPMMGAEPPLLEESREAKRARLETERSRRVGALFSQCATIVKAMKKCKDSYAFSTPVDPIKLNIPDYHTIVTKPMDLGTIVKRLEHKPERGITRYYDDVYQFRDDVRQVWENCRLYNAAGQPVRIMGDNLSETWEKRWQQSGLEKKWEEELRRQKAEDMELDGTTDVSGAEIPKKLQELDADLRQLHAKLESQDRPKPVIAPPNRDMTFEEKRKLSQYLGMVPADKLDEVLAIVSNTGTGMPEEEEIELDIDSLDNAVLWELDKYVREQLGLDKKEAGNVAGGPPAKPSSRPTEQHETTSKPAGGSGAAGDGGGTKNEDDGDDSSSSSSSGDSSSEGSDEEVGSRENVGSTFGDGRDVKNKRPTVEGAGDATTLVSATRPSQQAQILKSSMPRKEMPVTNAAAWTALAAQTNPMEENANEGDKGAQDDELWKEFAVRAEEDEKRKKEKRDEEERRKKELEEVSRKEREEAELARKQQQEEEARLKREEEEKIEKARAAERAQIEAQMNKVDLTSQQALMKDFDTTGGGGADLAALGLAKADEDDDEDSDDDDEDI